MSRHGRLFDIVVWGGAGFTGRLVVEYICRAVQREHPTLRWAIAARDRGRAEEVRAWARARAGPLPAGASEPAILVGDAREQESVDRIVGETRVLLSTAGPFWAHGRPVVDACVRLGADYVDIAGETPWMRLLLDAYDAAAREKGVHIVPACGFDSVPSDLGTLHAALLLRTRTASACADVRCYVSMHGRLSGGTMATGLLMDRLGEEVAAQRADHYLLGGRPLDGADAPRERELECERASHDSVLGGWVAPFMMAPINTRVVRRSAELLRAPGAPLCRGSAGAPCEVAEPPLFGRAFCYSEVAVARDEAVARSLAAPPAPIAKREALIERGKLPRPGEGPSEQLRTASWFHFALRATAEDGTAVVSAVRGGDPGYDETAKMVAEAALCLALPECRVRLPRAGGVLTPASALGSVLLERLSAAGIRFEACSALPSAEQLLASGRPDAPTAPPSKL